MTQPKLYLKPNLLVEPLVNQWYAWTYLISPATAAMYIANSHLKIMQSFIATPQVHISALKNPAMLGGPFINYDSSKVGAVRSLMEKTVREQSHMLEFALGIKMFEETLREEATGFSLEPMYLKMPDALKGYVELGYDLNNNPSMRFIEGLLYRTRYANSGAQSIELSLVSKDTRSFIFSTPRLEDDNCLHLNIPFSSEGLDELFKMRYVPQSYGYIKDVLNLADKNDEMFSSFFTEEVPPSCTDYTGDAVRVRYLGHACVLIESGGVSIMSDPVISSIDRNTVDRYTYTDLPEKIDYVLLTHNHQDHVMFETLLQLRHKIGRVIVPKNGGGTLADPSLKLALQQIGFRNVTEIDEMETIEVEGGSITGLPFFGEHADLHVRTKTAFLVRVKGRTILWAADSNNIEPKLYDHLHDFIGHLDMVFLGMECDGAPLSWLYGPMISKPLARKMDQSRRLDGSNYEKGIALINCLKPKQTYVYAMGQEPWLTYLTSIQYTPQSKPIIHSDMLVNDCLSQGIISERLYCRKELTL